MIGRGSMTISKPICGYHPKIIKIGEKNVVDHIATPFIIRPSYFKLDARNKIYRIFNEEDVHLSLNSKLLCNVKSQRFKMKLIRRQRDGNQHKKDKQFIKLQKEEKNVFIKSYCYLIHSGYIPKYWIDFQLPINDYINTTINHKELNY